MNVTSQEVISPTPDPRTLWTTKKQQSTFFDNIGGEANDAGISSSFASNKGGEEDEAEAKTQWKNIEGQILTTEPKEVSHQQRVEVVLQCMLHREAAQEALLILRQHVADHQTGLQKHLQ